MRLPDGGGVAYPTWFRSAYRKWFTVPAERSEAPETRSTVSLLLLSWLGITKEVARELAALCVLCALFRCNSRSRGLGVMAACAVPGLQRASGGWEVWDGATTARGVR